MTAERMDHVGVVVDDLDAAIACFAALGLESRGRGSVEGRWVDRIIGLDGAEVDFAMVGPPGGGANASSRSARIAAATERVRTEDAELLDRLRRQ